MVRTVHADRAVVVDTNAYSVPCRLIGEWVWVVVYGGRVRVHHGPDIVADPCRAPRSATSGSLIVRTLVGNNGGLRPLEAAVDRPKPELLRPLKECAAAAGGSIYVGLTLRVDRSALTGRNDSRVRGRPRGSGRPAFWIRRAFGACS